MLNCHCIFDSFAYINTDNNNNNNNNNYNKNDNNSNNNILYSVENVDKFLKGCLYVK